MSLVVDNSEKVSEIVNHCFVSIYRQSKELCRLNKYQEALKLIDTFEAKTDEDVERIAKLKQQMKELHRQHATGDYDIVHMIQTDQSCPSYTFDYADFVGPVEVDVAPGKGRGVFATEDVHPGQLVIGSKAFAIAFPDCNPETSALAFDVGTQELLVQEVAKVILRDPNKCQELYRLYAGPELGFIENDECKLVDIKRIEGICLFNAFSKKLGVNSSTGLWLFSSFVNHSCFDCNCTWTVHGDFMLVRAFKPISKGEQVLITYNAADQVYSERLRKFRQHRFLCDCQLCLLDQHESMLVHEKREVILQDYGQLHVKEMLRDLRKRNKLLVENCTTCQEQPESSNVLPQLRKYIAQLEELRPENSILNPHLVDPLNQLAMCHFASNEFLESAQILEKLFGIIEHYSFSNYIIDTIFGIISSYLMAGRKKEAKEWADKLKLCSVIRFGTVAVLEVIGSNVLRLIEDNGISI